MESNLINIYKTSIADGVETELELRILDNSFELFKKLYDYYSKIGDPTFECAIYVMEEISKFETIRREFYYKDGILEHNVSVRKRKLAKNLVISNEFIKYSIGVASEIPAREPNPKASNLVRFKNRASFIIIYEGLKWRLDLTAVKEGLLGKLDPVMDRMRKTLCKANINKDNYINDIKDNFDHIDKYEIELEYIDSPDQLDIKQLKVITLLFNALNEKYIVESTYQNDIQRVAAFIYSGDKQAKINNFKYKFRDLIPQVRTLNKYEYKTIFPPLGYYLTIKLDGVHNLIMIYDQIYILGSKECVKMPLPAQQTQPQQPIIVEVEMYLDVAYVLDVLYFNDVLLDKPFSLRQTYIEQCVVALNNYGIKCMTKQIKLINNLEQDIKEIYNAEYEFPTDGIIFIEPNQTYAETKSYKWKPYSHNTIDFLSVALPTKFMGVTPYLARPGKTLYILFNSITRFMHEQLGTGFISMYKHLFPKVDSVYYPIQFAPTANPLAYIFYNECDNLNNQIVELTRNEDNDDWVLVKVRTDRVGEKSYYGNHYDGAEKIFVNFFDKFTLENLWTEFSGYFQESRSATDIYLANKIFTRMVIGILFKKYLQNSSKVIDLAIGRGADMPRYKALNIVDLLGIDIDASAIVELIYRQYESLNRKKRFIGREETLSICENEYNRILAIEYDKLMIRDKKHMTLHTCIADLKTDYCELSAQMNRFGYIANTTNAIVCNLAIHYMCDFAKNLRNVLSLVSRQLKLDGYFIVTTLNGLRVFELLKEGPWEYKQDDVVKYKFEKKYKSNTMTNTGQVISTLIPVSRQMMDEPLCNIEFLVSEAAKFGLDCVQNDSFAIYRDAFMQNSLSANINEEDWKYLSLWQCVVFRKIKELKKINK